MLRCRWLGFGGFVLVFASVLTAQEPVRLELLHTLRAEGGPIHSAAFSPDGRLLATGGELGDLHVLDVASRQVRWTAHPGDRWVAELAFSPDGSRLACRGRHLTIHDAATGEERLRIDEVGSGGFAWSADGAGFVYGAGVELLQHDGQRARLLATFETCIDILAVGSGGSMLVGDCWCRTWSMAGGGPPVLFREQPGQLAAVRVVGLSLAGGTTFDVASQGPMHRGARQFEVPDMASAFAVGSDGLAFAVGGRDLVRWWSAGGERVHDLRMPAPVTAVALHPDGKQLFAATRVGHQALFEVGRPPIDLPGHDARVHRVVAVPDGTAVAVLGSQWCMHAFDGRPAEVIPAVIDVTAGARGSELLLRRPGEVVVLDTATGNVRQRVTLGPTSMAPIHAGPGSMLCIDGTLHHADGRVAAHLPEEVQFLGRRTVARADDGRWGIGGCWGAHLDAGCFVTTDRNGANVRKATTRPVSFATFSPDGSRLFLVHPVGGSSLEGRLCILDAATFAVQKELDRPVAQWHFLDAQSALVVSGGKLQVWDVAKLSPVQTLLDDVGDVQLSDDRRTLLLRGQREVLVYRVLSD